MYNIELDYIGMRL